MIFATLLPLVFLVGVPVIIILYLMKPKGVVKVIPSLLLWKNAEKNERSVTFASRFIRNILMFLEITALLLLIFAAMSPVFKKSVSNKSGNTIIVIDNSGSMNMRTSDSDSETRLEKAITEAKNLLESIGGNVTIVTGNRDILLSQSRDMAKLRRTISGIKPSDYPNDYDNLYSFLKNFEADNIIILTDADGAADLEEVGKSDIPTDIIVFGEKVNNVGISRVSAVKGEEGYDISVDYYITGGKDARFDLSLYDDSDNLIEVRSVDTAEKKNIILLGRKISGKFIKAEITGVVFYSDTQEVEGAVDGLDRDNISYAVTDNSQGSDVYLVGNGNIYFEKAYTAFSAGNSMLKVQKDSDITSENDEKNAAKTIAFYDNASLVTKDYPRLVQGYSDADSELIDGALINVKTGDLIPDMSDYSFGAGNISVLSCPQWASPFMTVQSENGETQTVGYYGEKDGVKQVVLGFDIRNTEYPLMAEFPVFIADVISYLSNDNLIESQYITAGESVALSPSVSSSSEIMPIQLNEKKQGLAPGNVADYFTVSSGGNYNQAGLYMLKDKKGTDQEAYFVVRFPEAEGDGSLEAESVSYLKGSGNVSYLSIKRICLILALIILIIDWIIYARRNRVKGGPELYIRIALLVLVLLSCIGIVLPGRKKNITTIFLVDMSDSMRPHQSEVEDYIRNSIKDKPSKENYGVVVFGRDQVTDQYVNNDIDFVKIYSQPDKVATDIESAVKYTASIIPDSSEGRIVLLTDGKETLGDINNIRDMASLENVEVCAYIFDSEGGQDVYVEEVDMPEKMATGDSYNLKIKIYSNYDTEAVIRISNRSEVIEETNVNLTKGENTFVLKETAGNESIEERTVTVEALGDTVSENNSVIAAAAVEAPQSVLLVSGLNEDSTGFENLLSSLNVQTTVVSAMNAPENMAELLKYKTIIIDNAHFMDMPEGFVTALDSYVKDYGGGLIVTGGKESYAPGGYRDTVLEDILPVEMTPKSEDEIPSTAIVMIIDCSGSMMSDDGAGGRSKLDVAIDAALQAVDQLTPDDYVGVLAFSDNYEWIQPIVKAENKEAIKSQIEKIDITGGTVIKPAVIEGAEKISEIDSGVKHMLLLTDGEGETQNFGDATKMINDNNITMSTIAVGEDSDQRLLEYLAEECGGRYYYSDSSSDVPKIFTEEIYLSGTTYFKKGDFSLIVNAGNKMTEGLYPDGTSNISSYIATTLKNNARQAIGTDEEDPLLAYWQYGLGHSIAWTTNASGSWDENLAAMDDYAGMWKNMLSYASMQWESGTDSVSVLKRRNNIEITYTARSYSEDTSVKGVYTTPSGKTEEIEMQSDGPGRYTATFAPEETGIYSLSMRREENGEVVSAVNAIETVQFSDEYKLDISNENLLNFVENNGRLLSDGDKVFTKLKSSNRRKKDITFILLVIAILLLLADIFVRRFAIVSKLRSMKLDKLKKKEKAVEDRPLEKTEPSDIPSERLYKDSKTPSGLFYRDTSMTALSMGANEPETFSEAVREDKKGEAPASKKKGRKEKQPAPSEEPAGLDTAALLRKKKDRNL